MRPAKVKINADPNDLKLRFGDGSITICIQAILVHDQKHNESRNRKSGDFQKEHMSNLERQVAEDCPHSLPEGLHVLLVENVICLKTVSHLEQPNDYLLRIVE